MSKIHLRFIIALVVAASLASTQRLDAAEPETIANSLGMKLVSIPAGEFQMGAEEDRGETLKYFSPYCDPKWLDGELPRHRVRITKPLAMGKYEVTLGQFLMFYHAAHYQTEIERDGKPGAQYESTEKPILSNRFRPWSPGWKIEMDHPVVFVSWNDAVAFCKWLSSKEGKTYRLPTEAEWEYACRAGSNSRYSFGDDPQDLVRHANAADQDRKLHCPGCNVMIDTFDANGKKTGQKIPFPFLAGSDGYVWTAPVGKFQPNAFGLCDMHGNGWEWCADWYDEHYYEKSPLDDPTGPASGVKRTCRGGGYYPTPVFLRCASRGSDPESFRDCCNSFRVVLEQ
ncbi:MAG TPA: formylglycine-generating enzyme family protein [Pirellulales bacterium]|jgi:formylglycine-generating enzyme required for sulfatase activity|nr:formylglycine-generating enzyme family protein [Pirellulales bacterium]